MGIVIKVIILLHVIVYRKRVKNTNFSTAKTNFLAM